MDVDHVGVGPSNNADDSITTTGSAKRDVEELSESVTERWLVIPDFPQYEVSTKGQLRRSETGAVRALWKDGGGYLSVTLRRDRKSHNLIVHRLVAKLFITNDDPQNKVTVNHLDHNRENNCVENLEWATYSEQNYHAHQNKKPRILGPEKKVVQFSLDGTILQVHDSIKKASDISGISTAAIVNSARGHVASSKLFVWRYMEAVDLPGEVWGTLREFKGVKISNKGRVETKRGVRSNGSRKSRYMTTCIRHVDGKDKTVTVHQLVAQLFLMPSLNPLASHVNHKDNDGTNNDVGNLEWTTPKENTQHAVLCGAVKGKAVEQYDMNGRYIATYATLAEASRVVNNGSRTSQIGKCCNGKALSACGFRWKFSK